MRAARVKSLLVLSAWTLTAHGEVQPRALSLAGDRNAVDTLFLSDVHVGEPNNTWPLVEQVFIDFRTAYPNASYLVYTGDTVMHNSIEGDKHADEYILRLIEIAANHGFAKEDMFLAQGNNDGPHDSPLMPVWANAVAASGVVPAQEQATCKAGSYYFKCAKTGDLCGLILNTDLEVYGNGVEEDEDKARFNASLSSQEVGAIFQAKKNQHIWAAEKIAGLGTRRFFMMGHHPGGVRAFFPKDKTHFQGGLAGHYHLYMHTELDLTIIPGFTDDWHSSKGYLHGAMQTSHVELGRDSFAHRPYKVSTLEEAVVLV